jgi:Bifunctional DNA primase/polymerase, N-terminal
MGRVFLELEGRALPVFPCLANKKPACPHGFYDATSDPAAIAELWRSHWGPLVGVPTGSASGLAVIDIDPRNGGDRWFLVRRTELPQTRTHQTRSKGLHLIFRHSAGLRCRLLAPGVDLKGDGGYVVWWPTTLCRVLVEGPIAEFPEWLLIKLRSGSRSPRSFGDDCRAGATPSSFADGDGNERKTWPLPVTELPKVLYFKILELMPISAGVRGRDQRRVRSLLLTLVQKSMGRNAALNNAAFQFRELIEAGIVSREVALELLLEAATLNGYLAKDGHRETISTIRSGLGTGSGHPLSFTERHRPDE